VAAPPWPVLVATAALTAGADQWVKAIVTRSIPPGSSVSVITGLLSLTHVQNRGVAFGLLAGISPILMTLAALTLLVLLSYNKGRRTWSRASSLGFALMVGGAIGNLLDRVRFGFVVDYLDVHVWPVFNLADAAIVIGAGLVLLVLMRSGPGADSEVRA
jgi:signal peptidase II